MKRFIRRLFTTSGGFIVLLICALFGLGGVVAYGNSKIPSTPTECPATPAFSEIATTGDGARTRIFGLDSEGGVWVKGVSGCWQRL